MNVPRTAILCCLFPKGLQTLGTGFRGGRWTGLHKKGHLLRLKLKTPLVILEKRRKHPAVALSDNALPTAGIRWQVCRWPRVA